MQPFPFHALSPFWNLLDHSFPPFQVGSIRRALQAQNRFSLRETSLSKRLLGSVYVLHRQLCVKIRRKSVKKVSGKSPAVSVAAGRSAAVLHVIIPRKTPGRLRSASPMTKTYEAGSAAKKRRLLSFHGTKDATVAGTNKNDGSPRGETSLSLRTPMCGQSLYIATSSAGSTMVTE